MPFPPKQVFIDYLNLYYSVRLEERASWGTFFKSTVEKVASYATGADPVVEQLDSNLTKMEAAIKAAADFDDWFRLVFTLRKTAEECQVAKWAKNVSLSCLVLHGTASLILRELRKTDDFKDKLSAEIARRTERINELKKIKQSSLTTKYGQSVNEYNDEIKKLISELSQLAEITYVEKAAKYNLFGYLPKRNEFDIITFTEGKGNRVGLIELQLDFCEWLYAKTFQTTNTHIGFDQFLAESADSFHKLIAQQEKSKQRSTSADAAAASIESNSTNNTSEQTDGLSSSAAAASSSSASLLSNSSPTSPILFPSVAKRKGNRGSINDDSPANAAAAAATPRRNAQ